MSYAKLAGEVTVGEVLIGGDRIIEVIRRGDDDTLKLHLNLPGGDDWVETFYADDMLDLAGEGDATFWRDEA